MYDMNKTLSETFDEIFSDLIPLLDMTDGTAKSILKTRKEKLIKAVQARDTELVPFDPHERCYFCGKEQYNFDEECDGEGKHELLSNKIKEGMVETLGEI
jgi:hypothetical protein